MNLLSQKLALVRFEHLLVKFGALQKHEVDEIRDTSKSGEEKIRRIIEKLLTKVCVHKHTVLRMLSFVLLWLGFSEVLRRVCEGCALQKYVNCAGDISVRRLEPRF